MKNEIKIFLILIVMFLFGYFVPFENEIIKRSFNEAFLMFQDYTHQHILTCLIPAFFIAGAISVFLSQASVIKYLGAQSKVWVSYSVASVSGTILAVCSCTVLPLFAGIYKKGAGLGPATAFLYSGPAINILAIILTFKIFGVEMGTARIIGAVCFAVIIGIIMGFLFRKEDKERLSDPSFGQTIQVDEISLGKRLVHFVSLILLLIFASWGKPENDPTGFYTFMFDYKWYIAGFFLLIIILVSIFWFSKDQVKNWGESTWDFTKKVMPYLFAGVLVAGFLMGRPGHDALIPSNWIITFVGDNSIISNLISTIFAAFMYFATLTEVPIVQSLMGSGMAKGPALALFLAGPAVSLPNMLVVRSILGTKKTLVYVLLTIILSTIAGWIYGNLI